MISYEGYVTKQGHILKNWRKRYLVFNGNDLSIAYYETKEIYETNKHFLRIFTVTGIEEYDIQHNKLLFGFKINGKNNQNNYMEIIAYTDSDIERKTWIDIIHKGLKEKNEFKDKKNNEIKEQIEGKEQGNNDLSFSISNWFHSSPTNKPNDPREMNNEEINQLQNSKKKSDEMIRNALMDVEKAKIVGRETCHELSNQKETLEKVETDLLHIDKKLDYSETLLQKMAHPILHLFDFDKNDKNVKSNDKISQSQDATPLESNIDTNKGMISSLFHFSDTSNDITKKKIINEKPQEMTDLDRLSFALSELKEQAELINNETETTLHQLDRIETKMNDVDNRIHTQTKTAEVITKSGNIF